MTHDLKKLETYDVEMTDTFGGEANYSWVKRKQIQVLTGSSKSLKIRRAKKSLGLSNTRHKVSDYGECIRLDIYGACWVVFITWHDSIND